MSTPKELLEARPALEGEEVPHPTNGAYIGPPPRKYTRAVHERICDELRKGQRAQGACARAGITVSTFHEWIRRGKSGDPHLWQFAEDVEIAFNSAEAEAVDAITEGFRLGDDTGKKDTDAAKWFLERSRPDGFSKQVKTAVEGQIQQFMVRLEAALEPRVFEQVLAVYMGQAPNVEVRKLPAVTSGPSQEDDDSAEELG